MKHRRLATLFGAAALGLVLTTTSALPIRAQSPDGQAAVVVPLAPVTGSAVGGSAELTSADGGTWATIEAEGLVPGGAYTSSLHAGTCDQQSASFAALPSLDADADGRARAEGPVRFRGTDEVPLADLADGEHVIVIADSRSVVACGSIPAASGIDSGAQHQAAEAHLLNAQGQAIGEVSLTQTNGRVLVVAVVASLPPGFHGFHVHTVGTCDPETGFASAGGHFNPTGEEHPNHAGDQPNLLVLDDGTALLSFWTDRYTIDDLLDDDGSAFIIHAMPDNDANIPDRYAPEGVDAMTHSTGDAGGRIACGVVEAR